MCLFLMVVMSDLVTPADLVVCCLLSPPYYQHPSQSTHLRIHLLHHDITHCPKVVSLMRSGHPITFQWADCYTYGGIFVSALNLVKGCLRRIIIFLC